LSLLDQAIAYGAGSVQESQVRTMLGTVDRDYVYRLAEALAAQDGAALLAESDGLAARGLDASAILDELIALFHRIAVAQVVPQAAGGYEDSAHIAALATRFSAEDIQLFYQIALQGRADLALAPDETMGMSMTLLRLLAFTPETGTPPLDLPRPVRREPEAGQTKTATVDAAATAVTTQPPKADKPPSSVAEKPDAEPPSAESPKAPCSGAQTGEEGRGTPSEAFRAFPVSNIEWSGWIAGLGLKGMAAQLVANTEWRSFTNGVLTLALSEAQRHLANKANIGKLKKALEEASGQHLQLTFEMVDTVDGSQAARQRQTREQAQRETEEAFRNDAFVQALEKEGGEVRWETVHPVEQSAQTDADASTAQGAP
jgi:DNA polymerase-3 subunit gamma/tau